MANYFADIKMLNAIDSFLYNDFIFSARYRVWRHIVFWSLYTTLWAVFWVVMGAPTSFGRNLFNMSLWIPFFIDEDLRTVGHAPEIPISVSTGNGNDSGLGLRLPQRPVTD
jgi:hypothetical protein